MYAKIPGIAYRKELKAFRRIRLMAGETKTVSLDLPVSEIAYYDESAGGFVVEPVEYEVIVGRHSLDTEALRTRLRIFRRSPGR